MKKKFEIDLGRYKIAFENASGTPHCDYEALDNGIEKDREVKSIDDIMYFYNSIVVYGEYSDDALFRSSPPDDSIVEYLKKFIKRVAGSKKENSQYTLYESDGFVRKNWTKIFSMEGMGYSPMITIVKEWYSTKQRHEDKFKHSTYYNVTFSDGLHGEGQAFVLHGLNRSGILEIGKQADLFVEDFIKNYKK